MNDISAIIVVKGNPAHLPETIESIQGLAAEIIIADIGIDPDLKTKLKTRKQVRIVKIKENVPYVELIRERLKEHARHAYILVLDPDELVPAPLAELLQTSHASYDYFSIPRRNIIMGRWMRHSRWWPDYQVRFFRKESVRWPTEIHQQPQTSGKGYTVEAREDLAIVHYNYDSVDEYLAKAVRYARSEAGELIQSGSQCNLKTTVRRSLSEFISRFFADEGYKDGMHGFAMAFMQMVYYFLVYFYYWEMKGYPTVPAAEMTKDIHEYFRAGLYESNHWAVKKRTSGGWRGAVLKLQNLFINMTK